MQRSVLAAAQMLVFGGRAAFLHASLPTAMPAPAPPPHVWWVLGAAAAVIVILAASVVTTIIVQQRRLLAATRAFSGRLLAVQEEERARIARELHDDVIQRVVLLSLSLDELARRAHDPEFERRLRSMRTELADFADEIRVLAHRMHPTLLDHLGLEMALRDLADELRASGQLDVQVAIAGDVPAVPPDAAACLYRIAQEALRNVIKHAGVPSAILRLERAAGGVALAIEDRGVGFAADPRAEQARASRGLGLRSIGERARLFGGRVTIDSRPGAGTRVAVRIPLR